jgi:hypothetical protein
MPKYLVVGDVVKQYTFNASVEAKDFEEAERIAVAMARGKADGLITIHFDSADISVDNIFISENEEDLDDPSVAHHLPFLVG